MPNVKISALPEFTGNTDDTFIVMNDSGQTTTYKVKKETFLSTAYAGFAWTNNYFNIAENANHYIPFDQQLFNTDASVFELVNSGSTSGTNGDQGARIHFKKAGIYEITSQMHFYDLTNDIDFLVRLSSAGGSNSSMSPITLLNDYKSVEASSDQLMNGSILIEVSSPTYYTVCVWASDVSPANGPYPSNADNTPPRIFIKKLA